MKYLICLMAILISCPAYAQDSTRVQAQIDSVETMIASLEDEEHALKQQLFFAGRALDSLLHVMQQLEVAAGRGTPFTMKMDGTITGHKASGERLVTVREGEPIIGLYAENNFWRVRYAGHEGWLHDIYLKTESGDALYTKSTRKTSATKTTTTTKRVSRPKNCKKGKPCGNTCIARNKTCRIGN